MPPRRFLSGRALTAVLALAALLLPAAVIAPGIPAAGAQGARVRAVPVIVQAARLTPFVDRIEALGTLRANETVEITATVTDTVTGIYFDDGARVAAGDTLLTMADEEERALLEEANAAAEEARRQLARAQSLTAQGTVSRSVLDERRRAYDTAIARRRALQSRLSDRVITAPFDGVVGLRRISVGALVRPGDMITRLHDDSVMKLDFTVPSVFMDSLVPGAAIRARARALKSRIFEGTLSSLDNEIDPVTRSITARARIPNPDRLLRPGLLMSVELLRNPRTAVTVPEDALVLLGRESYVFVAKTAPQGWVAERRRVTPGARRPGEVEILEGLSAGERVVTRGAGLLAPGQPITIRAVARPGDTLRELLRSGGATSPDASSRALPEAPASAMPKAPAGAMPKAPAGAPR